ncbi:ferric reductase transmembrane component [Metschnikowia bicuspidata var. bicuspidata NRRL YB-4993]|uniref:ferric-chelate reductase (NADPH) n=1 Tax=Metschnikowia bicuspidata var. bicuspidata NRRL YB-4993 TaxID=869754 RepID=A0A1A0HA75_9ASCO|nr:ferric reductase transmembrane component [Metschnikowia bicuspidata var. bicuspidata NRRL YB-4993]OBA20916.1 ferric reductase transmembrane component [Metschnikowia bicuspidata var. bicuspidata NRRL YB-4993]
MRIFAPCFATLCLVAAVAASEFMSFAVYQKEYMELRSCHNALYTTASFCSDQSSRSYECYCSNENAMASLAGCAQYLKEDTTDFFRYFVSYCATQDVTITISDLDDSLDYLSENGENFTEVSKSLSARSYDLLQESSTTKSLDINDYSPKLFRKTGSSSANIIDYPIYVNETLATLYFHAYEAFYGNFNWSYWFSDALYAYWAFAFVVAAACNWSVVVFPSLRSTCNGPISKAWRKYITLPALVKKKKTNHQEFFGIFNFLVPSRLETIILSGFFWMTFLFNALYMDWEEGNPLFETRYSAVLRYVSDRTGVIGTMLLPMLILIGGRNNFLQWFTRWKFSTFVLYHRWIGRVIVALVFVHSIAYTVIFVKAGNYAARMSREYMIYGVVGTVAGAVICFQGLLFLRRQFYEVFLAIHIMMALAFVLGAWRHLENRMFMEWVFASVAVWSFDRLVRILRMIWFGFPQATVTLLADDCLRVVVPKPNHWPSVPGGHAWVYFCHSWYFWQSHPFTFLDSTVEENKIVFVLKTKKGATNYLTKLLATRPGKTGTIRVCVEGPYGEACSVKHQDNVVFVAGGNGIPGIFSECYDLAQKSANNAKQWIKLIWVLREILTIEWVWEELSSLKNTKVEATVYITRPEGGNDDILLERMSTNDESSAEEKDLSSKEGKSTIELLSEYFPHVTFKSGRPLMDAIVDEETEEAASSAAFITCGHPIMVDDLRYAVVQKIDKTEKRVDFFEQLQVWA